MRAVISIILTVTLAEEEITSKKMKYRGLQVADYSGIVAAMTVFLFCTIVSKACHKLILIGILDN